MPKEREEPLIDVADIREGELNGEALRPPYGPNGERREHIGRSRSRVDQVGIKHDHGISARMVDSRRQRRLMPEIS